MLPTIQIGRYKVTRLICGGNPFSGTSHFSDEMSEDMLRYYTMPRIQECLHECWNHGINTYQTRGDRHQMRAYLEHRETGGHLQWIAQTASEMADIRNNIGAIARFGAIAIYHHGTKTDNLWHAGKIDQVADLLKCMKDHGVLAGVGTHIPEVVEYAEEMGWEADFYMCCFYNLARGYKSAPMEQQVVYERENFLPEDPPRMTAAMRQTRKPCLGFKIMAASRNCTTSEKARDTFEWTSANIKPNDAVVVGMFQKYKNQVEENARFVREILG